MSENLNSLVQSIVQQRQAKLPEVLAKLEQLNKLEQAINDLKIIRDNPEFAVEAASLPFDKTLMKINEAERALDLSRQRLSRKNISIAIAGKARQGKSQMLQMLTGLTDDQIPTGDTTFCTAARSRIINTSGEKLAIVHFFTESEFLEKKVLPAYSESNEPGALGLSPKPVSLHDFLSKPLPPLNNPGPSKQQFYNDLQKLHSDMQSAELQELLGKGEQKVDFNHLRPYVTKDREEDKKFFHVVDYVEIRTPFEIGLPSGMEVFDLPGLGEMTVNIRKNMLKAVSEDADIVMLMRKPVTGGDGWQEDDFTTFDMLKDVFKDEKIQPSQWVSLILNKDIRQGNNNTRNVVSMVPTVPQGFEPIVCNCGDKEDVRQKVTENMNKLIDNAGRIDDIRIRQSEKAAAEALDICKEFMAQIEAIKGKIIGMDFGFDFDTHFKEFMADLRGPFMGDYKEKLADLEITIRDILLTYFMNVYNKMEECYTKIQEENVTVPEFPIFIPKELFRDFRRAHGNEDVVNEAVLNQLWSIIELSGTEMTKACKAIKDKYMDKMVGLIVTCNPTIKNIIGTNALETNSSAVLLSMVVDSIQREDTNIAAALKSILDLEITYEEHVLPSFYTIEAIDNFDPYSKNPKSSLKDFKDYLDTFKADEFEKKQEVFFSWMKRETETILANSLQKTERSTCAAIAKSIYHIFLANYRNFINKFIWGQSVEKGWKNFAVNNQATLWKEEFDEASSRSAFGKDLNSKIAALRSELQK